MSHEDLESYVVGSLCMKEYQFEQVLDRVPNMIRCDGKRFVHLDYLDLDSSEFEQLLDGLSEVVRREGSASCVRLFEDNAVDSALLGLTDPRMLFSAIELADRDGLVPLKFPQVVSSHGQHVNLREQVVDFVRVSGGPCGYEEIEHEFVEKRKYPERQVFAALRDPRLADYVSDCVVHMQELEWDSDKQKRLEELAGETARASEAEGRLFSRISDLAEASRLPRIPEKLHWTASLVACLLRRTSGFTVLGPTREAYVANNELRGAVRFSDLLAAILERDFGGAANVNAFQDCIREMGLVEGRMGTAAMTASGALAVAGQEVMLAHLAPGVQRT